MAWSNQGAMQGAAAGSAAGPWGTVIGAAAGGLLGGGDQSNLPPPPQLPGVGIPGAVSSPYGGVYVDPNTGRIVYTGAEGDLASTLGAYQNQSLLNELMGFGGGAAGVNPQAMAIDQQIAKLQDALNSQRRNVQQIDMTKYGVLPEWLRPDGSLKSLDEVLGDANRNDSWLNKQYLALGGHYGKGGFAQFVKDAYARNIQPAYASYSKVMDAERGNAAVRDENEQSILRQIAGLQNIKGQVTGAQAGAGGQSNSLMDYFRQAPGAQRMAVAKQLEDQNSLGQQRANRMGMGFSSQNELARGANAINAELALNQMAGQNFDQRLKLMDWLRGGQQQAQQTQLQQAGLGLQYAGQGLGVTQGQQAMQNQRDAANIGLQTQYQMGNANMQQQSQLAQQQALAGIGAGLGAYYGRQQPGQAPASANTQLLSTIGKNTSPNSGKV